MSLSDPARQKLAAAPADLRLAVLFSPSKQRDALTALLAVYLEIREILRECSDPGIANAKLAWWQEEINLIVGGKPRHPLTQNLSRFLDTQSLSPRLLQEVIESVRIDVSTPIFSCFDDVERYCYRRGGALLELAAKLAGARQAATMDAAHALGKAWQLANLVVQTAMYARYGRVYFSADDLRKHGVDQHIIGTVHTNAGLKALLSDYAQRAYAFQESASAYQAEEKSPLVAGWILEGLAQTRLKKFIRQDANTDSAPVELRPLIMLFTAWRCARVAVR